MKRRHFLPGFREDCADFFRSLLTIRSKAAQCAPAIEPLESRIALSSFATFTDSDGDIFTVRVRGPGTADVVLAGGDPERGAIDSITLRDTTAKSVLSISVKTPRGSGGDGEVTIDTVSGSTLKGFIAPKANLTGDGLILGALRALSLNDIRNGADITIGGTSSSKTKIRLGEVGDGSSITTASAISSLLAENIGNGTITAPALGKLATKSGALTANLAISGPLGAVSVKGGDARGAWSAASFGSVTVNGGDFGATLDSTAASDMLGKEPAVGKMTVTGGNFSGDLSAFGRVGSITVLNKGGTGGMLVGTSLTASAFGKIAIFGDVMQSQILAGAHLGSDRALGGTGSAADSFGPGKINALLVKGTVGSMTAIASGLTTADTVLGNADDAIVPGATSTIGKLRLGDATDDSYFRAGTFSRPVFIAGQKVDPLNDPRFKPEVIIDTSAPVIVAAPANDTGVSASDGITSDATISGSIVDASAITGFRAGFGATPASAFVDVRATLEASGVFTFSAGFLDSINGAPLGDGVQTLHLQAVDAAGNISAVFDVTFTVDTVAPNLTLTPTNEKRDVLPRELVFAIFDEPVFVGTQTGAGFTADLTGSIALAAQGVALPGRLVLDATGLRLTFVPASDLPGNTELVATVDPSKIFDLAGNAALPVEQTTRFQTVNTLAIPGTTVIGFVFDATPGSQGENVPLAGATVRVANAPHIQTVTDANGRFELTNTPAGKLMIDVDGRTIASPAGTFYPTVAELIDAAPGQTNNFPAFVFLPLAQDQDFVPINNAPGAMTMVTNPDQLPGWQLMVPGGAVERRDGSMADQVQIAPVPPNRLPAPLPPGTMPSMVITIQTEGGADIFRQPVPLTAPNLEGLPPGEKTMLWDFDHARGVFVPVGLATVSADGQTVTTDPGSGVVRPGWHFILRLAAGDVVASDGSETKDDGRPLSDAQKELLRQLRNDIALSLAKAALELAGSISPLGGPVGIGVQVGLGVAADAVGQMRDANGATDPNSLADRLGMALDFDGKAALAAQIMADTLLTGSDTAISMTKQTYRDALAGNQAAIDALSGSKNTLTSLKNNIGALKEFSKFASKINNITGGLQAIDDARRAYDQTQRVKQILKDPPGDATSVVLAEIEEQQAIIAENLGDVVEAVGRATEALFLGAQLSLLGATLPTRADQLTPTQQTQIQNLTGSYQSAFARLNAVHGGVIQEDLEAAVEAANKLKEIIVPPAENRVFYKLQMPDGSSVRGSAFGGERFRFDFVPGSGMVTAFAADPIKGSFGIATFALPPLAGLGVNTVEFSALPITLFRTSAPDANGNGLADNIDDVISTTAPSRATVIDLQAGIDPAAAGLVNPGVLGRTVTRGNAVDVAAGPETAYVASSFRTVQVVDVSRPTNPVIITDIETVATPERIVSRGERFAVTEEPGVVEVFDASNPTAPQRLLKLDVDSPAAALGANHLVIASGANLQSFDLQTGLMSGQVVLPGNGSVQDIFLTNDTVFAVRADAAGRTVTLVSASLSGSGALATLDSFQFNNTVAEQAARLAGGDGLLFVSNITADPNGQNPGFATINSANPSDLQLIGAPTAQTARQLSPDGSGRALAISNNATQPSVLLFDVTNPTNTGNLTTSIGTLVQPMGLTLSGNLGFVAIAGGGLSVVRYAAPDIGTQAPAVSITTAPGSVLTEGARLGIHVNATDDVQVQRVELVIQGDNVIASDSTYPFDLDLVGPSGLLDGQAISLVARAIDTAGNVAVSAPINLNYKAVPPHVIATTPAPGAATQLSVATIALDFDEPLQRGKALPADFTLTGAGADGQFGNGDDFTVPIAGVRYNQAGSRVTLSLPSALELGEYQLVAAAANLTDRGGNVLDGEFNGTFPSGNGAFGGDFTYAFTVAGKVSSIFPVPVFPTGSFPVAMVSTDFDRDGHRDIAVPQSSDGTVGILFGTGDGGFAPVEVLTDLQGATAIGAADLDGDGDSELVVGFNPAGTPQIAVFKNNADGTFAARAVYPVGSLGEFANFAFADLNSDGKLDLLAPGFPISVLLNDGAGNLGAAAQVANLSGNVIATGDVNGDNKVDVFAGRFNAGSGLTLGNGDGTFGATTSVDDVLPNAAHLVDLTGDGTRDLVYTSGSLSGGTLSVRRGNGDGSFGAAMTLTAHNNTDLLLEDLNGDGRLDAIATGGTTGMTVFMGVPNGFAVGGVDYNVPLNAFDSVLGDWDADGTTDVAVTDLSGSVGLVFGKGNGVFAAFPAPTQIYRTPEGLASGDFNNDGNLDLVSADTDANVGRMTRSITVYFGDGNHGFLKAVTFDAGVKANAVAVGDLNADGNADVVTVNTLDDSVSVLLGLGDGSFAAPVRIGVADQPRFVQLGDVTGDNTLDIVTGHGGQFDAGTISILPGNGNGGFGARTEIANGDPVNLLLVRDVNGDSTQDLVTASFSNFVTSTGVTIRLGNGNGTFGAANKITIPLLTAATLADVNKDNKLDLVTGDVDGDVKKISVRLGNGDGTFGTAATKTVASEPTSILVADFSRDTNVDIITASSFSTVQFLAGSGSGTFADAVNTSVTAPLHLAGNFGTDTDPDLVSGENGGVKLRSGNGNGTFTGAVAFQPGAQSSAVALGDINADGKLDAVIANSSGTSVSLTFGMSGGTFSLPVDYVVGESPQAVKLGDFNNDGRLDIITANSLSSSASLLLGQPGDTFAPAVTLALGTFVTSPRGLAVGDLNGDTKLDFVTANGSGNVTVRLGNGDGTFGAPAIFGVGGAQRDVSLGDLDGDGDLDIFSVTQGSPTTVSTLFNNGSGSFGGPTTLTEDAFLQQAALGDLDGDGDLDVAITRLTNAGVGSVSVRLNNGSGTFGAATIITASDYLPAVILLGDVTHDGRLDILTSNSALGTFAVLVNVGGGMFELPRNFAAGGTDGLGLGNLDGDTKLDVVTVGGSGLMASLNAS